MLALRSQCQSLVARGCFIISVAAFTLFLAALSYLFEGDGSAPSTSSPSPPPTALVQAAMPIPSPAATPESLETPGPLITPDRVSAFEGIARLKDEPRAVWSKTMGRPAESYPPDKHSAGRDTWKIGDLKMVVKWGRSKSGLLAEDIDIDAIAGASELSLAEAEQIAIYFGLSNSLITYPNQKIPWYIWHNVDGTPVASFGPQSPSLVGGKLCARKQESGPSHCHRPWEACPSIDPEDADTGNARVNANASIDTNTRGEARSLTPVPQGSHSSNCTSRRRFEY
jgi:hypothetical protein